jgi:amino acid transporter
MKTEGILGLIGGIFGILGGMFVFILFGFVDPSVSWKGLAGLLCGAVAIVGAVMCKKKPHVGGILMVLSAIAGTYFTVWAYFIADVLLIIGGIMAIRKGDRLIDEETIKQ